MLLPVNPRRRGRAGSHRDGDPEAIEIRQADLATDW